ncbi:MAG: hypothetical protein KJ995_07340 [Candidatus Omnitrophica bacterium]|nr:hypothetical protein [Candidatus Omnitrophota bacterium]MBU1128672.1 hypothetical protein [Candidatus Omnitrophota bacterium]MBU1656995.1 hypothetical protein [Candidatus Omnitrophota bacterium]MBU1785172.1 hypothetical protein [Candidatus Omnitrophota bacterium]MBU1852198.1 hypothetical protein [Candidatus Omnitrophota bacterium]
MFDPIFKLALTVSIAAHIAVVAPMHFFRVREEKTQEAVQVNYIIIEKPQLSSEKETYKKAIEPIAEEAAEDRETKEQNAVSTGLKVDRETFDQTKARKRYEAKDKERGEALLEYCNLIREKIRAKLHFFRYADEEGDVEIIFTISPDGRLLGIDKNVAGAAARLRQKAIRGIISASPFPAFPPELGPAPVTFSLDIKFAME